MWKSGMKIVNIYLPPQLCNAIFHALVFFFAQQNNGLVAAPLISISRFLFHIGVCLLLPPQYLFKKIVYPKNENSVSIDSHSSLSKPIRLWFISKQKLIICRGIFFSIESPGNQILKDTKRP